MHPYVSVRVCVGMSVVVSVGLAMYVGVVGGNESMCYFISFFFF